MTWPEPMDAIPAEFAEEAELRRQELLEAAADCDDDLMEKVLMEEEVTVEELKAAIRKGTIACKIHPVFVGSSYKNKGVQELLDAVVDYMPSPVDIPAIKGTNPDTGADDERPSDVKAPFSALAFKIMTDPFVGKLTYLPHHPGVHGIRRPGHRHRGGAQDQGRTGQDGRGPAEAGRRGPDVPRVHQP